MKINRILIAGLIGGVFALLVGWLIFGFLLTDFQPITLEGFSRGESEMVWWAMILSNLIWGIFIAYFFVQSGKVHSWMDGLKEGAIITFLIIGSMDIGFYAMSHLFSSVSIMILDIVVNTVFGGLIGAVIGWWLGRKKE